MSRAKMRVAPKHVTSDLCYASRRERSVMIPRDDASCDRERSVCLVSRFGCTVPARVSLLVDMKPDIEMPQTGSAADSRSRSLTERVLCNTETVDHGFIPIDWPSPYP